jgi:hypothetical protein
MDFAGLSDEPVARCPHKPAIAGVRLLNQILRRIDDRIERYLRLGTTSTTPAAFTAFGSWKIKFSRG